MTLGAGTVFLGGLLTFASPCVLPLIPIYLSVLLGGSVEEVQGARSRMKLLLNGVFFVLGFLVVFVALGLTATALGRTLIQHRLLVQQIGGMLVFFFGLKFLGLVKLDAMNQDRRFQFGVAGRRITPPVAFLIGLTFAFGWTPCVGPILGSILTFTAVSANSMAAGAFYLLLYGLGVGLPLLLVAVFAQQGVSLLRKVSRFLPRIEKGTGAILVLMSLLMVTDSLEILTLDPSQGASQSINQGMSDGKTPGDNGAGTTTISRLVSKGDSGKQESTPEESAPSETAAVQTEAAACDSHTACDAGLGEPLVFAAETIPANFRIKGPIALEFVRPDCGACMQMVPLIEAMKETCSGQGLPFETLDISIPENREFARYMGVVGTPTLVLFDKQNREVSRLVGVQTMESLHQAVSVVMGEACADYTPFD